MSWRESKSFLLNNNSRFADILEINGTATGAPKFCSYSDIIISQLDKIVNEKRASKFQEPFCFSRYRDDCLILWCEDIEKLNDFPKMLNALDEKLKFTMEIEGNSISFLHLKIHIQNNHFETIVYNKSADSHLHLEASCHKKSSKNSIIKGVALSLRKIYSTIEDFKINSSESLTYLVGPEHSSKLMKSEFDKVSSIPRH